MLPLLSSVWRQLIFRSAFHRTWWTAKRWYHYWPKDSRWPKPRSVQSRSESGKGGLLTFFTCRNSFNHVHLHHVRPLQAAVNYSLLFICFGKHSFPTRAAPPGIRIHTLALQIHLQGCWQSSLSGKRKQQTRMCNLLTSPFHYHLLPAGTSWELFSSFKHKNSYQMYLYTVF